MLELALDASEADVASPIGSAARVVAAVPDDAEIVESDLVGDGTSVETARGAVDPGLLAAAQSQEAGTDTVRGLAAVNCIEAVDEAWLVGGSTAVGRSSLVLLANPGTVASTVELRIHGQDGLIDAPGAAGIVVPAGTQQAISLAGLAPDEPSPVVQVVATGAPIAASLEQSVIRGLAPGGVDLVGASAAPAARQVVPGVAIAVAGGVDPGEEHATGDDFAAVRLLAPETDAEADIRILGADGAEVASFGAALVAGEVLDVPLGELAAGEYTLDVDADEPVVAAVRVDTGEGDERDFAWAQAAAALGQRQLVAVAAEDGVLVLANPGSTERIATIAVDGAEPGEVRIAPGASASVPVDAGSGILLGDADGLRAAVVHSSAGRIAIAAVQPPSPLDSAIRVYPR
nr:DUF5719 family protein [Agromyces seonyuensis]